MVVAVGGCEMWVRIPPQRFPHAYTKFRSSLLEILALIFLHAQFLTTKNYNVEADRNTDNWMVGKKQSV